MVKHDAPIVDAPCLRRLGLMSDPFPGAIDDRLFYADAPRAQHLDLLHHLTQHSELLLVVTGERGAGKTSLLRQFVAQANESWRICVVDANPMTHEDQLLRQMFKGFGLAERGGGGHDVSRRVLHEHLDRWQRAGDVAVLIVDDAHDLPLPAFEVLMQLSETAATGGKLLRMALFCEPQIESLLNAPQIQPHRHRVTHTLTLSGFSQDDTASFVRHRLAVAGLADDSPLFRENPFTPAAIAKIFKASRGLPALVNGLAAKMLAAACREHRSPSSSASDEPRRGTNWTLPISALIAALALGAVIALQDRLHSWRTDKVDASAPPPEHFQPKLSPQEPGRVRRLTPAADAPPEPTAPSPPSALSERPEPPATPLAPPPTGPVAEADNPPPKREEPKTEPAPPAENGTAATDAPAPPSAPASTPGLAAEGAWLIAADPQHYTLQLLGASRASLAHQFITLHGLQGNVALVKTLRNGKEWYVLLYGAYVTKQEARAALANLPDPLKKASPWLRSIASVRSTMVEDHSP